MGLTALGFSKKTLAQIKSELEVTYKDIFGQALNVQPGTVSAKLIGVSAERESALWDLLESIYFSQYPNTATGVSLANVGAMTNSAPRRATSSYVLMQALFGTEGETIPAGVVFSVIGNPSARFVTLNPTLLGAGVNAEQEIEFDNEPTSGTWTLKLELNGEEFEFDFDTDDEAIQTALQANDAYSDVTVTGDYTTGFVIGYEGLQGKRPWPLALVDTSDLLDGVSPVAATVTETIAGVAQAVTMVEAESTGPVYAPTGTLNVIETPVTGLDRTVNLIDAVLGANAETDAEFRLRRENELAQSGNASVPAIKAKLETVPGVTKAIVFENTGLTVDGEGRPPKSVQAFVVGGDNQAIGEKLWEAKAGGIETFGDVEVTITDSEQNDQTVYFNRPTIVPLYVDVEVQKNPLLFPINGMQAIVDSIVAFGLSLSIGEDVYVYPRLLPAIVNNVPGIINITIKVGSAPTPSSDANIDVAPNELASFDSSRITVGEI